MYLPRPCHFLFLAYLRCRHSPHWHRQPNPCTDGRSYWSNVCGSRHLRLPRSHFHHHQWNSRNDGPLNFQVGMGETAAMGRWERLRADRNYLVKAEPAENWEPQVRQGRGREVAMLVSNSKRVTENGATASQKRA